MSKTEAVIAGKRATTRANNKDSILIAAREVFTEIGFGGTTVRDIIRRTGLASGTFYNYFTGKEEVFDALIADIGGRLRPRLRSVRANAKILKTLLKRVSSLIFPILQITQVTMVCCAQIVGARGGICQARKHVQVLRSCGKIYCKLFNPALFRIWT